MVRKKKLKTIYLNIKQYMDYNINISESLSSLFRFVEKEGFVGYDPYDYLNSPLPIVKAGKMAQAIAVQAGKLIPFNLRPILGIKKGENPKGLGLMLHAYCNMYQATKDEKYLAQADYLYQRLLALRSPGKEEYCWGYNFIWANPHCVHPKYMPSAVVSSFVGQGIYQYYLIKKDENIKMVLLSVGDYILNNLHTTETKDGLCLSYTEEEADCCYNASLLGAEMLAIVYALNGDDKLREFIKKCVYFVLAHQHEDGSWGYSIDVKTGKERLQIDFHQGFVLCSLDNIKTLLRIHDERLDSAIKRGLEYYRKIQFTDNGVSLWRIPKQYPVEIHNQAQGIITFAKLSHYGSDYSEFAKVIADWTIRNMRSNKGYFYYRKFKWYTIKTPYMRWSQAWMLLALSRLELERLKL